MKFLTLICLLLLSTNMFAWTLTINMEKLDENSIFKITDSPLFKEGNPCEQITGASSCQYSEDYVTVIFDFSIVTEGLENGDVLTLDNTINQVTDKEFGDITYYDENSTQIYFPINYDTNDTFNYKIKIIIPRREHTELESILTFSASMS